MSDTDEVHCPECDDPECVGCEFDHTKFSNELDIWDTWDDEGGSIPPEGTSRAWYSGYYLRFPT